MITRPLLFIVLCCAILANTKSAKAQSEQYADDCHLTEAASIEKARQQRLADSIDEANYIPAKPRITTSCATPSITYLDVTFNVQPDRISGFFKDVENANKYLIVLTDAGEHAPVSPINGIYYKSGSTLGAGRVIAYDAATAFVALNLKASTSYNITIYAANENCQEGVKYSPVALFSKEMKTTGSPSYNLYYGNLHSHSSYSDGNQDNISYIPSNDYQFAKDAQCMDFLGISEHNHYSYPRNPGMHVADYQLGLQQANAFTSSNPGFLALYGMEFGVIDNGGHMVVYGVDSLFGWETLVGSPNYNIFVGKYDYTGSNGLFNTVNRFRSKNAFVYCAHPNDSDYGNLLGIQYQPFIDSALIGSALENGPAFSDETNYNDYPSTMSYLTYFKKVLAKGYHIGPTMDHDNHNYTFGRTAKSRLVVMSPSLDKDDFMNAMRSMSFYATHSCTAVLDFELFGTMMGKEMQHIGAPAMTVVITDPSTTQQPKIRIYKGTSDGNQASIIATGTASGFAYTDETLADGQSAYYFVDIAMGKLRTVSAPIWYTRNDNPVVTAISAPSTTDHSQLKILENPVLHSSLSYTLDGLVVDKDAVAVVRDLYGNVVVRKQMTNNSGEHTLNVDALPAGVYILTVITNNSTYSKKFVKY